MNSEEPTHDEIAILKDEIVELKSRLSELEETVRSTLKQTSEGGTRLEVQELSIVNTSGIQVAGIDQKGNLTGETLLVVGGPPRRRRRQRKNWSKKESFSMGANESSKVRNCYSLKIPTSPA